MSTPPERTVILYHGGCPDGFGGAYAAWKKFGDAAEYMPLKHQAPPPEGLEGAHLIFIDFCFPKEIMEGLVRIAASVLVLDHHEGVKDVVESMPAFVYEKDHSGAVIAWSYFHPNAPVPALLSYVEDGDLYRFALPDARAVLAYCYARPFDFASWDELAARLQSEDDLAEIARFGAIFEEYRDALIRELVERAKLVRFEGYECYFSSTISAFSSDLANRLAKKRGPLALAVQARPDGLRVSLRGDGTVNVAQIAQKYGGNGHPNAAAFSLPYGAPLPWEKLEESAID